MPWVETERRALVETFRTTSPEAPTLCEGWDTRRLLAHLVQREHDLPATVGDVVTQGEPGNERFLNKLVDGARTPEGYEALIGRFAGGPPKWSPFSWAGENINLLEYIVHHEDVRRGAGPVEPRSLPAEESRSLWTKLPLIGRVTFRKSPVGVVLARPTGGSHVIKKGEDAVTLTGDPVELALYLNGRREAARVEVSGAPEAVARFDSWVSTL
ncbi:MAG: TIGR03085 family metal-binding protein [Propionibacteriaceae bacterium]